MRGRKPRPLSLAPGDFVALRQVARAESMPWYQVRRARMVLAIAAGEQSHCAADRIECDEGTVWRTCRHYEGSGLAGLMAAASRSGHPPRISPPQTRPDRRPGLPGAGGQGPAHHPLVQP
jgi:hypothetical protein